MTLPGPSAPKQRRIVTLRWKWRHSGGPIELYATRFDIYRRASEFLTFEKIGSVAITGYDLKEATEDGILYTFSDPAEIVDGNTYRYQILAVGPGGISQPSEEAQIYIRLGIELPPPPAQPRDLIAVLADIYPQRQK